MKFTHVSWAQQQQQHPKPLTNEQKAGGFTAATNHPKNIFNLTSLWKQPASARDGQSNLIFCHPTDVTFSNTVYLCLRANPCSIFNEQICLPHLTNRFSIRLQSINYRVVRATRQRGATRMILKCAKFDVVVPIRLTGNIVVFLY